MNYNYIEDQAENLLKANGLFTPGFNIETLIRNLSINLIPATFSDNVSGYFVMRDGQPVISYDETAMPYRTRFTIAHELGHFILHSKTQAIFVDKAPKVFFRNSVSASGEVLKEREANAFAAGLLMPRALVIEELKYVESDAIKAVNELAKIFDVSPQAMSFRLSNLGYDVGSL